MEGQFVSGKEDILRHVLRILESEHYMYEQFYNYSFDVFADNDDIKLVIKALYNVDVLSKKHANDMFAISLLSEALPVVVGVCGRNYVLREGIAYIKEGIYAMNLQTFNMLVKEGNVNKLSKKGKEVVEVDVNKIKKLRERENMSLSLFASYLGISKKTAYLLEKRGKVGEDVADKIERLWGVEIKKKTLSPFVNSDREKEVNLTKSPYHKVILKDSKKIGENVFVSRRDVKREEKEVRDAIRLNDIVQDPHIFIALTPLSIKLLKKHGKEYIAK